MRDDLKRGESRPAIRGEKLKPGKVCRVCVSVCVTLHMKSNSVAVMAG